MIMHMSFEKILRFSSLTLIVVAIFFYGSGLLRETGWNKSKTLYFISDRAVANLPIEPSSSPKIVSGIEPSGKLPAQNESPGVNLIPPTVASEFSKTINGTRIGIEKITLEKYFVVYSLVTGNESYLGINFIMEDLNHQPLPKNKVEIWLENAKGQKLKPLPYFILKDFPPDKPLGWKLTYFAKFAPIPEGEEYVNVFLKYQGEVYEFEKVPLP